MTEFSIVAKATIVLGLALIGAYALRGARASVRALLLSSAFGVLLVLPAAALLIPERSIEIPMSYAESFPLVLERVSAGPSTIAVTVAGQDVTAQWDVPRAAVLLRALWAVAAVGILLRLGIALWRLRTMKRAGMPWLAGADLVATLAREGGLRRRVDVFVHEDLGSPMTFGLRRPAIGLPMDAPAWDAAALRHAIVHELEHLRRGDWVVHLIAHAVCAFYWFHPLVWIASRRLCLEAERACDDAVLRDAEGTAYAEQLVSLARRLSHDNPVAVLSMATRSDLSTRVRAVLDPQQTRGPAGLAFIVAIVASAIALTLAISPLQAVSRMVASPAQAGAGAMAFEVASIRPSPPGATRDLGGVGGVRYLPGGRLSAVNAGLLDLIVAAYRVQFWQFSAGPGVNLADGTWINPDMMSTKDRYIIEATAGRDATPDEMRQMLQSLLADRFNLVIRRETRAGKTYDLVVEPGGHKLTPVAVEKYEGSRLRSGGGRLLVEQMTMPDLARYLQGQEQVQTTVIDRTGLAGVYEFNVVWTPQVFRLSGVGRPPENGEPGIDPNGPSMFDALREQAGLRLRESTGPVEHLIIERAEHPSSNDAPQAPAAARPLPPAGAPQGLAAMIESPTTGPNAPRFEVASVKRNPGPGIARGGRGGGTVLATGQVRTTNSPLRQLISMAYGLRPTDLLLGGPEWIDRDGFDVDARPEKQTTVQQSRLMLRTLLAERFKLAVARETREMPVYALVLARSDGRLGSRIARPVGECVMVLPGLAQVAGRGDPKLPEPSTLGAIPPLGRPGRRCGVGPDGGELKAGSVTMTTLITLLTPSLDRPVVDKTGLTGTFDFDLRYAGARMIVGPGAGGTGVSPGTAADAAGDAPTIFTALQEQLGLKLEPQRGLVDVLVVHQAEQPTGN